MTQPQPSTPLYPTDSFDAITPRIGVSSSEDSEWAQLLNQTVASQLKGWRRRRRLSAQQLSERCTTLGQPIPRTTIANIETGRRGAVSVVELLVLAMALNVPPVLLLYPLGVDATTAICPAGDTSPWFAIRWHVGERSPVPGLLGQDDHTDAADAQREWGEAHDVVVLHRRHDQLVRRYRYIRDETLVELKRLTQGSSLEPEDDERTSQKQRTDLLARDLAKAIDALRRHRDLMTSRGYVLPALPADIDLD